MIRFNLLNLLKSLEERTQRKIRLKDVAEQSGCDKNALSRLVNHPDIVPSASVVDKLIQYFFYQFKELRGPKQGIAGRDRSLMSTVIKDFISVYPDAEEYWRVLPPEIGENKDKVSVDVLWGIYSELTKENPSDSEIEDKVSTLIRITQNLKKQIDKTKGDEKLKISLSKDEADFLHDFLVSRSHSALM